MARLLINRSFNAITQGLISVKTLQDLAKLRSQGVLLVLITGARSATLLQRLPFLPEADAYVCENGGRIFYAGSPLPTACPLSEDMAWRTSLSAAGEMSCLPCHTANKCRTCGQHRQATAYATNPRR